MSIDTSGKWWKGSEAEDIEEYLNAFSAQQENRTEKFTSAKCSCGSIEFQIEADAEEGTAKRTCVHCKSEHFICESEEFWKEASPKKWKCIECKCVSANIGVGFSFRKEKLSFKSLLFWHSKNREIKWLYVGVRCAKCKILGCVADWKIDYMPSLQLLEKV